MASPRIIYEKVYTDEKNLQYFYKDHLKLLKGIHISLSDEKDYSPEEFDEIYTQIMDYYQVAAFDEHSEPLLVARDRERIIDTFYDKTGV